MPFLSGVIELLRSVTTGAVSLFRGTRCELGQRLSEGLITQFEFGKISDIAAREMATVPSSRGCHRTEDVAGKLAETVEEEQPIVRERDLAGTGDHAAADQSGVRGGEVRGTIGTLADAAAAGIESSYKAVDFGGLEGFFEGQWGKGS